MYQILKECLIKKIKVLVILGYILQFCPLPVFAYSKLCPLENNYIYSFEESEEFEDGYIYRQKYPDGPEEILYRTHYLYIGGFHIEEPWIYYLNESRNTGGIEKIKMNGESRTVLAEQKGAISNRGFEVDESSIYWCDDEGVKMVNKDGGGVTLLSKTIDEYSNQYLSLLEHDDLIYWIENDFTEDTYNIYSINKTGKGRKKVYSHKINKSKVGEHMEHMHYLQNNNTNLFWLEQYIFRDGNKTIGETQLMQTRLGNTFSPELLYRSKNNYIYDYEIIGKNYIILTERDHNAGVDDVTGNVKVISSTGQQISIAAKGLNSPTIYSCDKKHFFWIDYNDKTGEITLPDKDGDGRTWSDDCDDNDAEIQDGNTCGSNLTNYTVSSENNDVTVTFDKIIKSGNTSIAISQCSSPIEGITITPFKPVCAEITTTAKFEGSVKVCMQYDDNNLTDIQEANLRMVHCKNGNCELITCDPPIQIDTKNNIICACTKSFSKFVIGIPSDNDSDLVPDLIDNCPDHYNIWQEDTNKNGIGDICETSDVRQYDRNHQDKYYSNYPIIHIADRKKFSIKINKCQYHSISIFDLSGRCIKKYKGLGEKNYSVDLNNYNQGVILIKSIIDGRSYFSKYVFAE